MTAKRYTKFLNAQRNVRREQKRRNKIRTNPSNLFNYTHRQHAFTFSAKIVEQCHRPICSIERTRDEVERFLTLRNSDRINSWLILSFGWLRFFLYYFLRWMDLVFGALFKHNDLILFSYSATLQPLAAPMKFSTKQASACRLCLGRY